MLNPARFCMLNTEGLRGAVIKRNIVQPVKRYAGDTFLPGIAMVSLKLMRQQCDKGQQQHTAQPCGDATRKSYRASLHRHPI